MGYLSAPDPPDYGPLAEVNLELGQAAMDFAREQWEYSKEQTDKLNTTADKVVKSMLKTERANRKAAAQDRQRYEDLYVPLEDEFVREAETFDTPERRAQEAGRATSEVAQAIDAERAAAERRLSQYGIDPSMLRAGSLDTRSRIEGATAKAQAGTEARRRVEDMGRGLRADAINMGRGLPSQAAQGYNTSLQAGQGAVGSGNQTGATTSSMMSAPAAYMGVAGQSYNTGANILNSSYNSALGQYRAEGQYGLPGLVQTGLGLAAGRFNMAEGGPVTEEMSPSGGIRTDDVPANLTAGEQIIPADVVEWKGREFFAKLTDKSRKDSGVIPQEGAAA